jgi:hypothetical protein
MDIMGAESVVAHDHSSAAAPPIYLNKKLISSMCLKKEEPCCVRFGPAI